MVLKHYRTRDYEARTSIGYLIKRAHSYMHDSVEPAFLAHGFTFMQWVVMMYLRDGIALNPKDICVEFRHNSGALTRILDQLADRGLIDRERSRTDRRKVNLSLTQTGIDTVESLTPIIVDALNQALGNFNHEEFTELTRLLIKLNANMAALAAPESVREN